MADTHYVVPPGTPGVTATDPFTNWATAGTNIIDVVNAAGTNAAPRVVWVTNGVYYPTNVIDFTVAITIQSVNGRDKTILDGMGRTNNRCAYTHGSGAVFDGFTITNYNYTANYGLVLYIQDVRNCLFVKNTTKGGCVEQVSVNTGSITNCIFRDNTATILGPGVYTAQHQSYHNPLKIENCRFESNRTTQGASYGGAMFINSKNTTISNCTIINNTARADGGGICFSTSGFSLGGMTNNLVVNCTITGNVVTGDGRGGGVSGYYYSGTNQSQLIIKDCSIMENIATNQGGGVWGQSLTIRNCLIARNGSLTNAGGGIYIYTNGIIENCTIVSNYAAVSGGGIYINGPDSSGTNNIIYFNTAASAANFTNTVGNTGLNYCCVIPAVDGTGNTTNNPLLKDLAGGDYRLRVNSPCVNAGTNQPWMTGAVDLEGNARIRYGMVDLGAYEAVLRQGNIYRVR